MVGMMIKNKMESENILNTRKETGGGCGGHFGDLPLNTREAQTNAYEGIGHALSHHCEYVRSVWQIGADFLHFGLNLGDGRVACDVPRGM